MGSTTINSYSKRTGFTLIELMIAVAIIGILAAIAIPRFAKLIAKSNESTTKGNLGALRSALSIYYGENTGYYPSDDLTVLTTGGKYLDELPKAVYPATDVSLGHLGSFTGVLTGHIPNGTDDVATADGWLYDNNQANDTWGHVIANCTHADSHGALWTSF